MNKDRLRLRLRLRKKLMNIFFTSTLTLACLFSSSQAQPPLLPGIPSGSAKIPVGPLKPVINIEIKDGFLSVELSDVEFGSVIKEIAEKAKFKVEISGDIAYRKIGTNFKGVDVERGIRRLLDIMKEKNYIISYNPEGLIDKLEIYSESSGKPVVSPSQRKPQMIQRAVSPVMPPAPLPLPPPPQFINEIEEQ